MSDAAHEVNFDGLVGPTYFHGGLAYGNIASTVHGGEIASPRRAALEGLAKMKLLADLGIKQAVLPPHERPDLAALRRLGFAGSDAEVLRSAHETEPSLLAACASASAMWTANAATVSPSADSSDGRVHFTPANLVSQLHRSLETATTRDVLKRVFADENYFVVHEPLPASAHLGDEGAANHTRLAREYGTPGVEVFVYGASALDAGAPKPSRYPARQTREASAAVARRHGLNPERVCFVQQNPATIDAGVFHNDVIAVGNLDCLLYHREAFARGQDAISQIEERFAKATDAELITIEITSDQLTLKQAVNSYFFNSQLISAPGGGMALVCPAECRELEPARVLLETIMSDSSNPISGVHYIDVRQSMKNGGGPACLRLRVALTESELSACSPGVMFDDALFGELCGWVERHYRERLSCEDLADPSLIEESRQALDELTRILNLGNIYPFQRR